MADTWTSRPAFTAAPGRFGRNTGEPGLRIASREGLGLASLIVAPGQEEALSAFVGAILPMRPGAARGKDCILVWSGPRHWLAVFDSRTALAAAEPDLARLAAVADQSASRVVLRLSGPRVRDVLAKGLPVDLDPSVFGPGDAAASLIAHIGVQIWQVDAAPTFDLAVPRSQIGSLRSWLEASAAEYGGEILAA